MPRFANGEARPLPDTTARGISLPMPVYLIIEERDGDELRSYAKYDITEPRETSLIRIGENSALEVTWADDLAYYRRRSVHGDAPFLEPLAHLEPNKRLK